MRKLLVILALVIGLGLGSTTAQAHEVNSSRLNAAQLLRAFLCIHKGEGAWNANTGNGYYGGLQMDRTFMRTYGSEFYRMWGTADNWPWWAQIGTAVRAYNSRGFYPWPNTARACGLL